MYTYSTNQLQHAVSTSQSYREAILKLGLNASGGAYSMIKRNVKKHKLDVSHFKGQAWLAGKTHKHNPPINLEEILSGKHPHYKSHYLKERLLKEGVKNHRCEKCNNSEWNGKPIPIELDHIDGNSENHRFKNLRILCPNCHAQTETYCGKNIGRNGGTRTHDVVINL